MNSCVAVLSETTACFTLAEGVALIEAVEQSGCIYLFAENYPYTVANQEMRRLYRAGAVGEFVYGEGEYVHPDSADFWNGISRGVDHWRNWLPSTYYSTHSLGPLMFITDTLPAKVNAFSMPYRADDPVYARRPVRNDACSMIAVRMDSGAVCKLLQYYLRGHGSWVRVHGSLGLMEGLRGGDPRRVRLVREQYHERKTAPVQQVYQARWPKEHAAAARTGLPRPQPPSGCDSRRTSSSISAGRPAAARGAAAASVSTRRATTVSCGRLTP